MSNDRRRDQGSDLSGSDNPVDPVRMAQRDLKKALPRRFYNDVTVLQVEGGFGVCLDGKPIRTPAKSRLIVPTANLAEALAAEWQAQGETIEPATMAMTRLANSAIDGVAVAREAVVAEVVKFAETDLVCYRAEGPPTLVDAERAAWDPVLAFTRDQLGAPFLCAEGVMYVAQPEAAVAAVCREVEAVANAPGGPFRLAALSLMTNLTGSVLLALMVARGALTTEACWSAAHVDEDHQMGIWGLDCDALQRRAHRWTDMQAAARCLALVDA